MTTKYFHITKPETYDMNINEYHIYLNITQNYLKHKYKMSTNEDFFWNLLKYIESLAIKEISAINNDGIDHNEYIYIHIKQDQFKDVIMSNDEKTEIMDKGKDISMWYRPSINDMKVLLFLMEKINFFIERFKMNCIPTLQNLIKDKLKTPKFLMNATCYYTHKYNEINVDENINFLDLVNNLLI